MTRFYLGCTAAAGSKSHAFYGIPLILTYSQLSGYRRTGGPPRTHVRRCGDQSDDINTIISVGCVPYPRMT